MPPNAPTAYPLAWPAGWPRTPAGRQAGPYRTSLAGALKNLRNEVKLLAGESSARSLILSSNVTLGQDRPSDPGVVAYFFRDGDHVAIPCDRWSSVEANVQAIALTIESMRAIERHGAKHMVKAMFQGFIALPAPEDWRAVLGLSESSTAKQAEDAYRLLARKAHPDAPGGSHEAMARLNAAINTARRELKS